jgi:hypothetical protein
MPAMAVAEENVRTKVATRLQSTSLEAPEARATSKLPQPMTPQTAARLPINKEGRNRRVASIRVVNGSLFNMLIAATMLG